MKRSFYKINIVPALGIVALLVVLSMVGLWRDGGEADPLQFSYQPSAVMGTQCKLTVVMPKSKGSDGDHVLRAAEAALRDVEVHMSTYLGSSELSQFNAAPAGKIVELSPQTMEVLRLSRELCTRTGGAFDVTCRPIIEVWKHAGKVGRLPTKDEIAEAKDHIGWEHIKLLQSAAQKRIDEVSVDLGGIAKGYAIDLAIQAMIAGGATGGLVDVGGDVRSFGRRADGKRWRVGVRNPFAQSLMETLEIEAAAVCTSGNYERFVEIRQKRYSHIVDPRTGWVAEMTPSVTVVAPTAAVADAWATALSVLGVDGMRLIPSGSRIEAMIVVGTPQDYQTHRTAGFEEFLAEQHSTTVRSN